MKQQLIILLILSLIFLVLNSAHTNAQSPTLWKTYCAPTSVAPGSETGYTSNLASALSNITTMADQGELEGAAWYGDNKLAEYAQALFYCRGEGSGVTTVECQASVADARLQLATCTTSTGAIVWYQECTVRVANRDIHGVIQTYPEYIIWSRETYIFDKSNNIGGQEMTLANNVIDKAAKDPAHGYADGLVDVSSNTSFGFMAQCSFDLIDEILGTQLCNGCLYSLFEAVQAAKPMDPTDTQLLGGLMPLCQILFGYVPIDQPLPKLTNPITSNSTTVAVLVSSSP